MGGGVYDRHAGGGIFCRTITGAKHVDRKPPVLIIALCNLLFAGVPLSYCLATASWMLLPVCVLLGIYNSGCDLAYFNGVLHYAPRDRVPQYQAVHLFLMGLRGIIAPLLGSRIGGMQAAEA